MIVALGSNAEEQEPPSEPAPSLPAHERAKQVSKAAALLTAMPSKQ